MIETTNIIENGDFPNRILSVELINKLADEYEEQVRIEEKFREDKRRQINELKQLIANSYDRPIYKLIYKSDYGDFREFSEQIAKELRRRNKNERF